MLSNKYALTVPLHWTKLSLIHDKIASNKGFLTRWRVKDIRCKCKWNRDISSIWIIWLMAKCSFSTSPLFIFSLKERLFYLIKEKIVEWLFILHFWPVLETIFFQFKNSIPPNKQTLTHRHCNGDVCWYELFSCN